MANNFKVFAESTINIYSDADFGTNQERSNGFQPNTQASSQLMNTALREACLAATALINICSNTSTTSKTAGPNSTLASVVEYINTGLAYWANGIVKGTIQSTPNTSNGDTIILTMGNGSSTQTTTVTIVNAKHAANADTSSNVSTYINNKAISNIFETDGLTVKKATQANNAATANSATTAATATTAEKLGTNAGSSTRPVYFSNGVPTQTNTSLDVSITGNAATATKLNGDTVGNESRPVYFVNGVPTLTSDISGAYTSLGLVSLVTSGQNAVMNRISNISHFLAYIEFMATNGNVYFSSVVEFKNGLPVTQISGVYPTNTGSGSTATVFCIYTGFLYNSTYQIKCYAVYGDGHVDNNGFKPTIARVHKIMNII